MTVLWSEPPPKAVRHRAAQVADLQANPGVWARMEGYLTRPAANALCVYLRAKYGVEAEYREIAGEYAVWARA